MGKIRNHSLRGRIVGLLAGLGALALVLFACGAWLTGYLPVRLFSAERWKDPTWEDRRVTMVEALLLTNDPVGMTRPQVEALLGPPTTTDYHANWDAVYYLGPERNLFSIDSEWLVLRFGPDGRVVERDVLPD